MEVVETDLFAVGLVEDMTGAQYDAVVATAGSVWGLCSNSTCSVRHTRRESQFRGENVHARLERRAERSTQAMRRMGASKSAQRTVGVARSGRWHLI